MNERGSSDSESASSSPARHENGLSWPVLVTIVLILVALAISAPMKYRAIQRRDRLFSALSSARQIYLANFNMANDFAVNRDPHLGWPGALAASGTDPVHNLSEFAERLVAYDYVKRPDLDRIFWLPDLPRYSGSGPFPGRCSAFKIYLITEEDAANTLFCATKNFTFGHGLDPAVRPYSNRGFLFVRKGGDALSGDNNMANNPAYAGLMPGHKTAADPGEETSANVWKD